MTQSYIQDNRTHCSCSRAGKDKQDFLAFQVLWWVKWVQIRLLLMMIVLNLWCGSTCRERWGNLEREDMKESPVLRFLCGYLFLICFYSSIFTSDANKTNTWLFMLFMLNSAPTLKVRGINWGCEFKHMICIHSVLEHQLSMLFNNFAQTKLIYNAI